MVSSGLKVLRYPSFRRVFLLHNFARLCVGPNGVDDTVNEYNRDVSTFMGVALDSDEHFFAQFLAILILTKETQKCHNS
jgi:hypothetical protein